MDAHLIRDVPASGTWNMALDEALLAWAATTGGTCLRFYQWSPATLSLGYFQKFADRDNHPPSCQTPLVRRASGGGAILHDQELTYSLVTPSTHRFAAATQTLVETIHQSLIDALKSHQIDAHLCGPSPRKRRDEEPFLCFERRAPEDVLVDGWKIAGSAQRRNRGAVLQHGSILLETSQWASELPGIAQIAGVRLTPEWLDSAIRRSLTQHLNWSFRPWQPGKEILDRARWWETHRFAHHSWNKKR